MPQYFELSDHKTHCTVPRIRLTALLAGQTESNRIQREQTKRRRRRKNIYFELIALVRVKLQKQCGRFHLHNKEDISSSLFSNIEKLLASQANRTARPRDVGLFAVFTTFYISISFGKPMRSERKEKQASIHSKYISDVLE